MIIGGEVRFPPSLRAELSLIPRRTNSFGVDSSTRSTRTKVSLLTSSGLLEAIPLPRLSSRIPSLPTYVRLRRAALLLRVLTSPFPNTDPLTWLLKNGQIFMQADWQTTLLNYTSGEETRLPNITIAQKTYPASGATAMLPQTGTFFLSLYQGAKGWAGRGGGRARSNAEADLRTRFAHIVANNYSTTLLFCGGMTPERDE